MPITDPEKRREYYKKWRESHPNEMKQKTEKRKLKLQIDEEAQKKQKEYSKNYEKMRYQRDKEKRLAFNKEWREKNREKMLQYQRGWNKAHQSIEKDKRQILKQKLIDMKGGKCEICGWSGHQSAFDFHHIDPKTREWQNGRGGEWILKKYRGPEALMEVNLLCANCHRILHHGG